MDDILAMHRLVYPYKEISFTKLNKLKSFYDEPTESVSEKITENYVQMYRVYYNTHFQCVQILDFFVNMYYFPELSLIGTAEIIESRPILDWKLKSPVPTKTQLVTFDL